jgi:predicted DNA-binding transcriptional regulator AlpA
MSRRFSASLEPRALSDILCEELLTPAEAARFLRLSTETLKYWRKSAQRRGPPFVKIERRPVRYRLAALEAYIKRRTVRGRKRG